MANWFVNEDVIDKYLDGVSEWSKLSALQADYRWVRIPPPSPNIVDLITEKHFGGEKKSLFHDIFIPEIGFGK